MIEAIIFDMDGLMFNTEAMFKILFREVLDQNHIPAPDIFLETAKRLNVDPKNCLVLEDSKNGIIAAAGAHMHSIFVPDQIVPDEEMKPYIQTTCQSLKDVIAYLENQPAMV